MKKQVRLIFCLCLIAQMSFAQDSLNMTVISQWDPDTLPTAGTREYNDIWGYVDCEGNEYVIIGSASRIHFFDINDPANPEELAEFEGGDITTWRDMKTYQNHAYAVSDNTSEGLMVFDLTNIQDTIIKTYQSTDIFSKAHNIYVDYDHGRMYVAGADTRNDGLIVLDLNADPNNPVVLSSVSLPGGEYVHDVFVRDHIAYCSHGWNGYYIWDFTDPVNPTLLSTVGTNGYNHSSWVSEDGTYAIFAEEVPLGLPLGIIDLTELAQANTPVINTFKFPLLAPDHENNVPHNPFIRGNHAIVSHYHDGIQIFDLTDPMNPQQVAYYDTHVNDSYSGYQGNWGVYPFFPSGIIAASDINEGLILLTTTGDVVLSETEIQNKPNANYTTLVVDGICQGTGAIGLLQVAEGAQNYQWYFNGQPTGSNQNFLIPSEGSGEYYVEISTGLCMSTSEVVNYQTFPIPDLSDFNYEDFDYCSGETPELVAPAGFDNYLWFMDGEIIQQGEDSTFTISSPGSYQLAVIDNDCPATSGSIDVGELIPPEIEILNTTFDFCANENIVLNATPNNFDYTWYLDGELFEETTDLPELTTTLGGNYEVVATGTNGCTASSPPQLFEALAAPETEISTIGEIISFDNNVISICANNGLTIAVPQQAGNIYAWYDANDIQVGNMNTFPVDADGEYYIQVTAPSGCTDESELIEIVSVNFTAEITEDGATLSASVGASYQWYDQVTGIINGATESTFMPTQPGDYYCVVTSVDGCIATSNTIFYDPVSIDELPQIQSITLLPNPVEDILQVQLEAEVATALQMELLTAHGQQLMLQNWRWQGTQSFTVNMTDLPGGVYLLRLSNAEGQMVRKVIKL